MAYEVAIEDVDGVLRAEIRGTRAAGQAAEEGRQLWFQIADECRDRKTNLVLLVSHLKGPLSTLAAFEIGANLPAPEFGHLLVIAYVNLDPGSLADSQFAETVARNRGWTVEVFGDESDAWRWIEQKRAVRVPRSRDRREDVPGASPED